MRSRKKTPTPTDRAAEVQRIIAILHSWGIHTLGQFAALNKEDVSLRLGPEGVRMWERAAGKATRLLKLVQPPEIFAETFEFEREIETAEPLLFMLRRFLEQLSVRLGALYFVARELRLRITFSDKTAYEHTFTIPEPGNNVEVLFRMLHTHLENFQSAAPIVAVALEAQPAKPGRQQFSLFETALRDPMQLSETLARLLGLLGSDRVGRPVLEDTWRADAFRMEPFRWELPDTAEHSEKEIRIGLRRFRVAPESISRKTITHHEGPYVSSGDWWDEKNWSRSEWDVALTNDSLARARFEADEWQIEGLYD